MPGNDDLTLLVARAEALSDVLKTEDGENLIQAFRRANNILTQAEAKDGVEYSYGPDLEVRRDGGGTRALRRARPPRRRSPRHGGRGLHRRDAAMAALRAPIDAFFEACRSTPTTRRSAATG
jgi:glycyl-tRNA synthetase beta chain